VVVIHPSGHNDFHYEKSLNSDGQQFNLYIKKRKKRKITSYLGLNSLNIKKKRTITSYLGLNSLNIKKNDDINIWLGNSGPGLGQAHNCDGLNQIMESQLATGQWFSPGSPVSSNNKTDSHDIVHWNIVESGVKHHQTNK
jgi:hypothetical protein